MLEHAVAAYTFSKSYSMSGWRIGFAVAHPDVVEAIGKLINTTASCSPPFVQWAAQAALEHDAATRDDYMGRFRRKVERLCGGPGEDRRAPRSCRPAGTFYVFPDVRADLQPPGDHLARPGPLPARRGRRRVRRRLPGRRVLRRGRPRLPPLQLRRARRADRPGHRVPARGPRPARPRPALPRGESPVRAARALSGRMRGMEIEPVPGFPHRPRLVVHLLVHGRGRRLLAACFRCLSLLIPSLAWSETLYLGLRQPGFGSRAASTGVNSHPARRVGEARRLICSDMPGYRTAARTNGVGLPNFGEVGSGSRTVGKALVFLHRLVPIRHRPHDGGITRCSSARRIRMASFPTLASVKSSAAGRARTPTSKRSPLCAPGAAGPRSWVMSRSRPCSLCSSGACWAG